MSDEFSPEQQVMVEVMRVMGTPNPEAVVRRDRVAAALFGSYVRPALQRMAMAVAGVVEKTDGLCCTVVASCLCAMPKDHDGAHICSCGGSWRMEDGRFVVVSLPRLAGEDDQ